MRPTTLPRLPRDVESENQLRSETAALLHGPTYRISKLVGVALAVGESRVHRMIEAREANHLEMLTRWLDRLEIEGADATELDAVVEFLARRRGRGLTLPLPVKPFRPLDAANRVCARTLAETGEAVAALTQSLEDNTLTEEERVRNRRELRQAIDALLEAQELNESIGRESA